MQLSCLSFRLTTANSEHAYHQCGSALSVFGCIWLLIGIEGTGNCWFRNLIFVCRGCFDAFQVSRKEVFSSLHFGLFVILCKKARVEWHELLAVRNDASKNELLLNFPIFLYMIRHYTVHLALYMFQQSSHLVWIWFSNSDDWRKWVRCRSNVYGAKHKKRLLQKFKSVFSLVLFFSLLFILQFIPNLVRMTLLMFIWKWLF